MHARLEAGEDLLAFAEDQNSQQPLLRPGAKAKATGSGGHRPQHHCAKKKACAWMFVLMIIWMNVCPQPFDSSTGGPLNMADGSPTEEQAWATGLTLWKRRLSWIQRNESRMASATTEPKTDSETGFAQDTLLRTLQIFNQLQALLEPFIPAHAPGLVRLSDVDWKAVAVGCLANRHPRQELPTDPTNFGLTKTQVLEGYCLKPNKWILQALLQVGQDQTGGHRPPGGPQK
eukprot:3027054-Amphidinium_carterae.1